MEKLARRLTDRLDALPGVREARYSGAPTSEVHIELNLAKLSILNLSAVSVEGALSGFGSELPIGTVDVGDRRFNVKSNGAYRSLDDIRNTPISAVGGRIIRVGDVSTVNWAYEDPVYIARFNGKPAILITITQKEHEDLGRVTRSIRAELDSFDESIPPSVHLERGFFQADNSDRRLQKLNVDFLLAIALVLFTLLPLGFRAGAIVAISIPLSLLGALILLKATGYTLNQLSVAGFVLALGLLVDDSIVIIENITRRMREGETRLAAAINGPRQMGLAVLGCTATLVLAFLPLAMLPAGSGAYIRSLPVAVLCAISTSFVVAFTVVPFLASRVLTDEKTSHGNLLLRFIEGGIHGLYYPVLRQALARPWLSLVLMLALCATSIPMLKMMGTSLFPAAETPQFLVRVEGPGGSTLSYTDRALRFVESRLTREPDVAWEAANLGRGNPQIFYNQGQHPAASNFAEVFVGLKSWRHGSTDALLGRLRGDFDLYPDARIQVVPFQNGPPVEAPIEVRISGEKLDSLKALATRVEAILRRVNGIRDVRNPIEFDRIDLDLGVQKDKAALLGAGAGATEKVARLGLAGDDVSRYRDDDGDDYVVKTILPASSGAAAHNLSAISSLYVPTTSGISAPFSAIANPVPRSEPTSIDHYDRQRTVTVTGGVVTGALVSRITEQVKAALQAGISLPPGYRLSFGGEEQARTEGFSGFSTAILLALFGIVGVLILEFKRFRTALAVAGIVPFGIFGGISGLWLTGNSLSFTAAIGLIALIGIELKNSILFVDFSEALCRSGVPLREAIERAGRARFLPVLLTSTTAIFGMIPLAVEGSGLYSPLAIAIIGGLFTSTFLSRVGTPVMYWLATRHQRAG